MFAVEGAYWYRTASRTKCFRYISSLHIVWCFSISTSCCSFKILYILAYPTLISTMCFWDEHGSSGWGDVQCTSIPWLCHKSNWVQVVIPYKNYVQKRRMRNFRQEKVCAAQSCIENGGSVVEEERLASPQPRLSSDLSTRTVLAAISTELQLSSRIKTLP